MTQRHPLRLLRGPRFLIVLSLLLVVTLWAVPALLGATERPWGPSQGGPTDRPQGQTLPNTVKTGWGLGLDTDGVVIGGALMLEYNPPNILPLGGIGSYGATATYDGDLINVVDVRPGLFPFDTAPTKTINNPGGITTFSGSQNLVDAHPFLKAAKVVPRLVGCKDQPANFKLDFTSIVTREGATIPEEETSSSTKTFLRGDAKRDGVITSADVLIVAQYLVGRRQIGEGTGQVHPINAGSVKYDGATDKITTADLIYIAQMLVGLRNKCYVLLVGG